MVLSQRERRVFVAAAAVVVLLAADRFAIEPLRSRRAQIDVQREAASARLLHDQGLLRRRRELGPLWATMQQSLSASPSGAESTVLHWVRDAAQESGLQLLLLRPERLAGKTPLPQIAIQASLTGSMQNLTTFLHRLESAQVPLRVSELQVSARKEGADDLSVQVRMSTLCLTGQGPAREGQTRPASQADELEREVQ